MRQKVIHSIMDEIRDLSPAYFALVMATGIISIAYHLLTVNWLSFPLFYLNQFFYIVLWLLFLIRIFRYPLNFVADLVDYNHSPGFLTLVAGTNVLGSQFVLLEGNQQTALILWILGLVLWFVLIFAFFTIMTVKQEKPTLDHGINGAWMLIVVSTQSITVLGMLITSRFNNWRDGFEFSMIFFYLLGCMFYILLFSLILYRFLFFKLNPEDLTPPYWINMGAVAITTLAGANVLLNAEAAFFSELAPFIKGFTLFYWTAGTWWIPLLFLLGFWRHIYMRYPFSYNPLYWGMVFPLGMYTACTLQLSKALNLPFLLFISHTFIYIALLAWIATFIGLLHARIKRLILIMKPT